MVMENNQSFLYDRLGFYDPLVFQLDNYNFYNGDVSVGNQLVSRENGGNVGSTTNPDAKLVVSNGGNETVRIIWTIFTTEQN